MFLGSALDNIGAVGNIVLGNPKKEDSFSNFLKFIKNQCYSTQYPDIVKTLVEINDIKDNYRTQIAHRGRIGTHWKGYLNIPIPYVQSGLKGKISPEHTMSWREEFRDVEKGRIPTIPIPQLCYEHLLILEKAVNSVFSLCAANLKSFYDYNNVKLIKDPSKRLTKLKPAPADAEWILFRCRESHQPYLKTWIHDLTDPLPEVCIGETCNSPAIDAL
ncbi:hypothetical protein KKB18_05325 [bacterium]|nr:hypothetical protein [bacterium]